MTITKAHAKRLTKEWGHKRLPVKGAEYIRDLPRTSLYKYLILAHDTNGAFRFYYE